MSRQLLARPARPRRLAVAELRVLGREDAVMGGGGIRHRLRERPLRLSLELVPNVLANSVGVVSVLAEPGLVALDWIAPRPLREQLLRHVAHVVVRAVPVHPHGHGLDQGGALAATRALTRVCG